MSAEIIDGKLLSQQLRADVKYRAARLAQNGDRPGLCVILVGADPASQVYVRNKVAACEDCGFYSVLEKYEADYSQDQLLERIRVRNNDSQIHGILVQLPLPKHIDTQAIIEAIAAEKDVDGFHINNAGALMTGRPLFRPCTPYGVMKMLESINYPVNGANAVIVGASNIVGKPQAMLLLQAGATITICNSKTRDLGAHTRNADILVVATGIRNLVTADMIKPGAVVLDVGMNRDLEGKLCGDVDYVEARKVAGYISPVPGGVGPMTITMLLVNTIEATERGIKPIKATH
jgi:methylenetetrahydrofolate dehydrogenase (NADP+)/methenyltetrahydrofolate cyclohydrolase